MRPKESVLYVLPGKMGGVVTNLANLQGHCTRDEYHQQTILTYNELERDTLFQGEMGSEYQFRFVHALPLENLHSVLRRFHKLVPSGGGVLVSSDWLELAWVNAYGTERAVFQILHGDFDYYYDLALRHDEVVDVFIACSRLIYEKLTELLPHRKGSIHHVPYGVPISGETRQPSNGGLRVLYAGRLEQGQKRVLDLPRIDRALRRRNVNVRWTIAGGGPDEEALRAGWTDGDQITWAGVLSNRAVVELMTEHDVLLLPSESEGLPLALLEAMGVGLVPVVSDIPSGVRELVAAGRTGLLAPVGDVEAFADGIAMLDADRRRLEAMSANARHLIAERFHVRRQAAAYEDLYKKWRDLRRPKRGRSKPGYGSRLDQPWIPNAVVRFIRGRRRPELRSRMRDTLLSREP
jgi:glycosyltransferase involved in cell wall biosynthesis